MKDSKPSASDASIVHLFAGPGTMRSSSSSWLQTALPVSSNSGPPRRSSTVLYSVVAIRHYNIDSFKVHHWRPPCWAYPVEPAHLTIAFLPRSRSSVLASPSPNRFAFLLYLHGARPASRESRGFAPRYLLNVSPAASLWYCANLSLFPLFIRLVGKCL